MTELWEPPRTSRLWKRGDPSGLPRNGLIALYDPYRDTYGRNVLPVGADCLTGWSLKNSATWDAGTSGPELHDSDPPDGVSAPVYRVRIKGGSYTTAFQIVVGGFKNPHSTMDRMWFKPLSGSSYISGNGTKSITAAVAPDGQWHCQTISNPNYATNYQYTSVETGGIGDSVDLLVCAPQVNLGRVLYPYSAPSGAPGTLQTSLDYSGHGNHLTLGATTGASTDDPAFTGTAWSFDGGDYLKAAHNATLDLTQFSCAVVFKRTRTGTTEVLFDKTQGTAGGFGYGLYLRSSSPYLRAYFYDTDVRGFGYTSDVSKDVYHLVTVSMVQGAQSMWLDGVEVATGTVTWDAPKVTNYYPLMVGAGYNSATPNLFFSGDIPYLCLYNRPFSASEHARIARTLKGMMTQRGVTPSW